MFSCMYPVGCEIAIVVANLVSSYVLGNSSFKEETVNKLMELGASKESNTQFDCKFTRDQPSLTLWFIRPG